MSTPPPLLEIKELQRLMIGPVSLDIVAGECLSIAGPSGTGKSLLLRAIADLDPHTGEVWLEGVPAAAMAPEEWRSRVGLLPPESSWWLPLVRDHFYDGVPVPLEHIGLSESILDQPVARLSSGEKQRLALMRLLSNRPRVLLLDEPTANLDPDNTRRIEAVIAEYCQEQQAAVIWVSHDRQQAARVAERCFEVTGGVLQARKPEALQ